jgi:transcriptional regulator with XRE-family HTH domain
LREERGILLKDMAADLGVSATYLSALEHGRRSKPNWSFVQRVIHYFNIIWDEADELQRLADLSDPRIVVETAGLSQKATLLANLLSRTIGELSDAELDAHVTLLELARKRTRS